MSDAAVPTLRARWRRLSGNSRGALWMLASGVVFSVMALAIKLLGQRLDNLQIGFFRVVVGFAAVLPFVARAGLARVRTRHLHVHAIRAVFGLLAMYCSYYAIAHMPLADYTALSFTKPLFATFLAVVILHEVVRWRRWTATAIGFLGVIVMVRPGATTAFQPAALAALVEAFSIAFLVTLVKRLPPQETTTGMLFHFGLFASVLSLGPAIYAWQWPTAFEWLLLIGVGVLGAMAQSFWIRSFRAGDASVVAPFDYLRLLFAGFIGFAVFSELPTLWTLIGAGVIVTSTLYIAHREAQLSRKSRPAAPRR
ncbi:MAG TPA: DMT family transporter [Methylomirabilota bacterium]|nr:DMT family transporter [Methylomirabilota bacterium]